MRRRLEDAAKVDCDACSDSCANWGGNDDDVADESNYVEFQARFEEGDCLQSCITVHTALTADR